MDASELIDKAMQKTGANSLRKLAEIAELDHAQMSKWKRGELPITIEGALILASLAELRPETIAGQVVKPRTKSRVLTKLLKTWAKAAAALLLCATAICDARHGIQLYNSTNSDGLYIMSNTR